MRFRSLLPCFVLVLGCDGRLAPKATDDLAVASGRSDEDPRDSASGGAGHASEAGPARNVASASLVPGGSFRRGAVATFRLDNYEVTVGRFRAFVRAVVDDGWRPTAGAGKHTHLNGGAGLALSSGGYETGWDPAWTSTLPSTNEEWNTRLACDTAHASETWTPSPGRGELRPQDCLTWLDSMAFCIWDGGFLPSDAEWEYAAMGGDEHRAFPWGDVRPERSLAIFECLYSDPSWTRPTCSIAPVGSAPAGNGKWGHSDLAGNVWEWVLDSYDGATNCVDCTTPLSADVAHVLRGGSFYDYGDVYLRNDFRGSNDAAMRPGYPYGVRCARP